MVKERRDPRKRTVKMDIKLYEEAIKYDVNFDEAVELLLNELTHKKRESVLTCDA